MISSEEKLRNLNTFTEDPIIIDDEKSEQAFSSNNIQICKTNSKVIECKGYQAYVELTASKNFVSLRRIAPAVGFGTRTTGEKIHNSLANLDDNIERAWNIFKRHAINNQLNQCKVVCDSMRDELAADEQQRGKEITIYVCNENRNIAAWHKLLEDITIEFITEKIVPGDVPPSDNLIEGSQYFSFRNDKYLEYKKMNSEAKMEDTHADIQEARLIADNNPQQIAYSEDKSNSDEEYEITYDSHSSDETTPILPASMFKTIAINIQNQPKRVSYSNCSPCCRRCIIL